MKRAFISAMIIFLFAAGSFGAFYVPSAKVSGMGNAYTAVADGASAIGFNPAGLAFIIKDEILVSTGPFPTDPNINYSNVSAAAKTDFGVVGFSASTMPILLTSGSDEYIYRTTTSTLSYSHKMTNYISYGVNMNYETTSYNGYTHTVPTLDFGLLAKFHSFSTGLMIGSAAHFTEIDPAETPANVRFGLAYKPFNVLTIAGDYSRYLGQAYDQQFTINSGIEYTGIRPLTIRAGYISNQWSIHSTTQTSMIGASLYLSNEFCVDFSRGTSDNLAMTDAWSLRYIF